MNNELFPAGRRLRCRLVVQQQQMVVCCFARWQRQRPCCSHTCWFSMRACRRAFPATHFSFSDERPHPLQLHLMGSFAGAADTVTHFLLFFACHLLKSLRLHNSGFHLRKLQNPKHHKHTWRVGQVWEWKLTKICPRSHNDKSINFQLEAYLNLRVSQEQDILDQLSLVFRQLETGRRGKKSWSSREVILTQYKL